jgi:drug/metabolite transporter (DMT)-like permease
VKTALAFCLIASLGYGVGAVLQAVGARRANAKGADGIISMARQPIFLLGLLADFGSWLISRFALHTLPLFAVQTILAGSLAVTVLLAGVVLGAQLGRIEKSAVVMTMVGLVIVGVSAGEEQAKDITHLLKVCILLGIPAVVVLGLITLKLQKSVLLAVLSGASFTGSALAARSVHLKDESLVGVVTEPLMWAVLIYAVLALGLHAVALMRGSVGPVTAAMWSTEVLVATIIGAVALGDHMRPGWTLPAILGIGLTLAATIVLARSPAQDLEHRNIPVPSHPAVVPTAHPGRSGSDASVDSRA